MTTYRLNELPTYFAHKALPTRIAGVVMLLMASPLILLLVIIVRLTSEGPGLYRQTRCGRSGVAFTMYKIRTMYSDAESVTGPVWCAPNDSRITPLGRVLRLLHLDELPQLINVARGEMDLIGPRPERPVFVAQLENEIPDYAERLRVLPGVTGLAQINLPPDETIDCVRKKLVLDCTYIGEANFFLDMRILTCTFLRMIGVRHGRAVRLMRVGRHVEASSERNGSSHKAIYSSRATNGSAANGYANDHFPILAVINCAGDGTDEIGNVDLNASHHATSPSKRLPR
jgi:lipopolysaccharide/colanic/teichoic acid biosynthesis glycosyltransferase